MTRNDRCPVELSNAGDAQSQPAPEGWRVVRLRDVLSQRSTRVKVRADQEYVRLGVRWYAEGCFRKAPVSGAEIKGGNLFKVAAGDFIYNRLFAWKGSFAVVPKHMAGCYVSNEFPVFEVDSSRLDPYYLWRWFSLPSTWRITENLSTGSTRTSRLRFREEELLGLSLPAPPLHEQHAVVRVLDRVQRAREATVAVIAAARELKKSLMRHLFTYGPVPVQEAGRVPLKETEIGPVPKGWSMDLLGDLVERVQYGTSERCGDDSKGLPVLRIPNVVNGRVEIGDLKYAAGLSSRTVEALRLAPGDLLFVRTNAQRDRTGTCVVFGGAPENALFASYLIRVRLRGNRALPHFVRLYTETPSGRGHLSGRASEAADGKHNINSQTIRAVPVPVPSLDEQQQIVDFVGKVEAKLLAEENRKQALEALFDSLLHNLMTGKVRVGQAETPASKAEEAEIWR